MDTCSVCGHGYMYGPGAKSHAECHDVAKRRNLLDDAVEWILSDDPNKGTPPPLVVKLRAELQAIDAEEDPLDDVTTDHFGPCCETGECDFLIEQMAEYRAQSAPTHFSSTAKADQ